jgi:hypothetical protein
MPMDISIRYNNMNIGSKDRRTPSIIAEIIK